MIVGRPDRAMYHCAVSVVVSVAIVLATAHAPSAQGSTATLSGTVVDELGGVVPGVTVAIRSVETGLRREVITDEQGAFVFPMLQAARYVLSATLHGFAPIEVPDIVLNASDQLALTVKLRVASVGENVVVTAQKREERLLDVPVPVAVVNTDRLVNTGHVLIRDYFAAVPGLVATTGIYPGANTGLSIRGVPSGTTSTVGVLIDDVPFGNTVDPRAGHETPDLDPGDLARIEVLRGPQGTLYGASSMGGLMKVATIDPSTDRVSGRVEVGTSSVYNGAQSGVNVRASVNVPLSGTVALRASVYKRQDPGYIDNPVFQLEGVNEIQADGVRLSALWRPSQNMSLKLNAMHQHVKTHGAPDAVKQPGLGELEQNYLPGGVGGHERTVRAYSAIFKAKVGRIDFASLTGLNQNKAHHSIDYSSVFGSIAQTAFGVAGAIVNNDNKISRVTQEVRLSGALWRNADWLAGAYYSNERIPTDINTTAADPITGRVVGQLYHSYYPVGRNTFEEYAAFANVTYRVTDRLDVQFGGRQAHQEMRTPQFALEGPYATIIFGSSPSITPASEVSSNVFTYLLTPRFRASPDLMVYARFASGFRPGFANRTLPGVPPQSRPDKTHNYELGVKGELLDHTLTIDASLYRIDYKDIQISLLEPITRLFYNDNAGEARSQGVELSVAVNPLPGLTIAAWTAYSDAVLTQDFPTTSSAYGKDGDRLPDGSRWSGNVSLDQEFPLWSNATGFVGGSISFVGDRFGPFLGVSGGVPVPRQHLPEYSKGDVRAGVRFESWTASLFVNNVANGRGLLGGGPGHTIPFSYTYIQPRTVGLNVSRTF